MLRIGDSVDWERSVQMAPLPVPTFWRIHSLSLTAIKAGVFLRMVELRVASGGRQPPVPSEIWRSMTHAQPAHAGRSPVQSEKDAGPGLKSAFALPVTLSHQLQAPCDVISNSPPAAALAWIRTCFSAALEVRRLPAAPSAS
jgi:hypothetical protein